MPFFTGPSVSGLPENWFLVPTAADVFISDGRYSVLPNQIQPVRGRWLFPRETEGPLPLVNRPIPNTAARWPKSFHSGPSLQTPTSSTLSSLKVQMHGYRLVRRSCNSLNTSGGSPFASMRLSTACHASSSFDGTGSAQIATL